MFVRRIVNQAARTRWFENCSSGMTAVSTFQIYWDIAATSVDADLDLQLVDATDGVYAPGDPVEILNYSENIGGSASTAYTINYYASTDTTITSGDISLGFESRNPLDPGAFHYYLTTATLPGDMASGPADRYRTGTGQSTRSL